MAEQDLRKWTTFFHDSGIPRGPASEYAGLFCDHRIKDDLLGDLTKDILNDIGITVMGDIMSILKCAKAVYAKLEREKSSNRLIHDLKARAETLEKDLEITSGQQVKKKKPVQKIASKPKAGGVQGAVGVTLTANKALNVHNLKTVTDDHLSTVPKKRPIKSTLTLSERFAGDSISPPKVSRISTELIGNNLSLKAKGPLGKTKSRASPVEPQIASGGVLPTPKRKSAFERLGEEAPSTIKKAEMLTSKTKMIKLAKLPIPLSASTTVTKGQSSVFKRLGQTEPNAAASNSTTFTIRTVTGLGSRTVSDDSPKRNLNTHSVLQPMKPTKAVKPVRSVSPVNTNTKISLISANRRPSLEKPKVKKSVFSRLGSP